MIQFQCTWMSPEWRQLFSHRQKSTPMQQRPTKFTIKMKGDVHQVTDSTVRSIKEEHSDLAAPNSPSNADLKATVPKDTNGSTCHPDLNATTQTVIDVSSSECSTEDEDAQSGDDYNKQLVLYDPSAIGGGAIQAVPEPVASGPPSFSRHRFQYHSQRVLPSVGAFTVQCANCFKWRLIPDQEKYEEIREHITEQPFLCETAREWRPDISCDDPPDIEQDGSRLWAIDKPNIAQTPRGWQRLLRIRGEGSTKFADVYYSAPSGKKLRSIPEVEKYLQEHPEEQGVSIAQFSFQIPRPLQEDYVRKRPARTTAVHDGNYMGIPAEANANPIAWAGPEEDTALQLGMPGLSGPYLNQPTFDPASPPAKKARSAPSRKRCNFDFLYKQHQL